MSTPFSTLELTILKKKGLTDEQLTELAALGITSRTDFETVGDATTLCEIAPGLSRETAENILGWALGRTVVSPSPGSGSNASGGRVILDTSDAVYCLHCQTKQPKDYSSGDLCINCGKQAEPTETCYWCSASGPGKFCRSCGATFVPIAELDLAVILRKDGMAKDDIPNRLTNMTSAEKEVLWGRVRHARA